MILGRNEVSRLIERKKIRKLQSSQLCRQFTTRRDLTNIPAINHSRHNARREIIFRFTIRNNHLVNRHCYVRVTLTERN